jgi:hypothetical protein
VLVSVRVDNRVLVAVSVDVTVEAVGHTFSITTVTVLQEGLVTAFRTLDVAVEQVLVVVAVGTTVTKTVVKTVSTTGTRFALVTTTTGTDEVVTIGMDEVQLVVTRFAVVTIGMEEVQVVVVGLELFHS